jgi:hypothetical protein
MAPNTGDRTDGSPSTVRDVGAKVATDESEGWWKLSGNR